ncbi:Aldose 1-epimerase, partial [Phytophthora palmivora]
MVLSLMFKTAALLSTLLASLGVANAELETVKLTHPTDKGVNPIRGGIPVVFPNFGSATGFPSHGFARITNWTLASVETAADETKPSVAKFTMAANDLTRKIWPVDFELEYEVKLYSAQLETALHVHNTFKEPIDFH